MYLPKRFEAHEESARELIKKYPLATVISGTQVSHLPLILESQKLIGHMARANEHWKLMPSDPQTHVIFHGPHSYISPRWYVSGRDVPTWNYAVVHVHGQAKLVEDFEGLVDILKKSAVLFDPTWDFELPSDLVEPNVLTRAIVGFEITIEKFEAKFKFGQNRSLEDRKSVIENLRKIHSDNANAVAEIMRAQLNP